MPARRKTDETVPPFKGVSAERQREWTIVSVHVANYLHDAGVLDAANLAQMIKPLTLHATLDGDIPARIDIEKQCSGPAWISWQLWPEESGRKTWGTMSVSRLGVCEAFLGIGTYDRSRKRCMRLRAMTLPDGKWGLTSATFARYGIETTY
jgi:hypothetical protein